MADDRPAPAGSAAPSRLSQLKIDRGPARAAAAQPRRRRWLWPAVGLAVLVLAGAAWLAPRTPQVQVATVLAAYPSQQYAQLTASGYVVAQRRAAVASKATGRLVALEVREGSVLKAGQLIARIDPADVRAAVVSANATIAQAEAAVRQAEASRGQAQAELVNAEAEYKRQQDLSVQGFVSPQAVEAALRRADAARAGVASAQAGIGSAQGGLAQARAQRQVQQVNLDNTEIRAPFDGVVLVKNANVGDLITPFSNAAGTLGAVVTMADLSTLEVEADVSESQVGRVAADQPVEITLDALPGVRFRGSVSRIVPTVDRAKATVMTKVRFEQLDARVLPEMSAKVNFLSQRPADADLKPVLAVNPKAVVDRAGAKLVLRVGAGDRLEAVPVTLGRTLGDTVEVSGALKSGERIVLSPDAKLAAGSPVRVAAAGAK
jgi:RND family efflux transporter MFP subunit